MTMAPMRKTARKSRKSPVKRIFLPKPPEIRYNRTPPFEGRMIPNPQTLPSGALAFKPVCEAPVCSGCHAGSTRRYGFAQVIWDGTYSCMSCGARHVGPCEHDGHIYDVIERTLRGQIHKHVVMLHALKSGFRLEVLECGHVHRFERPVGAYRRCFDCEKNLPPKVPSIVKPPKDLWARPKGVRFLTDLSKFMAVEYCKQHARNIHDCLACLWGRAHAYMAPDMTYYERQKAVAALRGLVQYRDAILKKHSDRNHARRIFTVIVNRLDYQSLVLAYRLLMHKGKPLDGQSYETMQRSLLLKFLPIG